MLSMSIPKPTLAMLTLPLLLAAGALPGPNADAAASYDCR